MLKIVLSIAISFVFIVILCSCNNSEISKVKNHKLNSWDKFTIGKAFDNYKYFKRTKWHHKYIDNSGNYVEVDALVHESIYSSFYRKNEWSLYFRFTFKILEDGSIVYDGCNSGTSSRKNTIFLMDGHINKANGCPHVLNAIYQNSSDILYDEFF